MDKENKVLDEIRDQNKKIMEFIVQQNRGTHAIINKLEKHDVEFEKINGRLDHHDDRFDKIDSRFDRIELAVLDTRKIVEENTKNIAANTKSIDENSKDIKGLKHSVDLAVTSHESRIRRIETIIRK